MSSVASDVKQLVFDKIDALPSVQVTYKHEESNPSGFPAVCITATGMDGTFWTTASNMRIYSYRVFVHFPIGQDLADATGDRLDNADDVVTTVIDQIMGAIDDDYTLNDAQVLFVDSVDSEYQYTILESGWARTAIVTVRVHTEYLLSNAPELADEQGRALIEESGN